MDQLIFASLSHTHYWYDVGMLKVPAVRLANLLVVRVGSTKIGRKAPKEPTQREICSGSDYFRYFSRTVIHSRSYLSGTGAA